MNNITLREMQISDYDEVMKVIAPVYEEVLPDYQYATVLGITPQSLSRIKREMKG